MNMEKKQTILVVDDDDDLREAIAFDFTRKGYNVVTASNGHRAFDIVKGGQEVNLVVSDVRMPGGDGVELLKRVKDHNYEIPVVIFITGFSDMSPEEAYDCGADAVFSKPFQRKELFKAVQKALTPAEARWTPEEAVATAEAGFEIELEFPEWEMAMKGQMVNLGRGGIFVALKEKLPPAQALANFKISFQGPGSWSIEGKGVVRWVRETPYQGMPRGCGIEFTQLSVEAKAKIMNYCASVRARAFIPLT
jgi:CheY-like chemotaxis protein